MKGNTQRWVRTVVCLIGLSLATVAHGSETVLGNFEGTLAQEGSVNGWTGGVNGGILSITQAYGVTRGQYALRLQPPGIGAFYWCLGIEFNVAATGGAEMIAAIASNTKIALDITFVEADWPILNPGEPGGRWVKWEKMSFNSAPTGWAERDMTADVDPIRKDYPGSWDPGGSYESPPGSGNWIPYGPVHTRTFTYDYSAIAAVLAANLPTVQWLQINFALNSGWNFQSGCVYVDNIRVFTPTPPLLGDTNNDGVVDLADYNNVVNNLGASGPQQLGDTNGDQVVDLADYNNVVNNLGASAPSALAVPEPASFTLLSLAGLALLRRSRR